MTRAAIYVRISSDPTGRAAGVQRQERDCRKLARTLGWTVVDVLVDNDVSAAGRRPRPAYRKLLGDLRAGKASAVLAWHSDRLYRRLDDLAELVDVVAETGAQIRTVTAGAVDLDSASGRMTARILGAVASHEIEHGAERIVRAKAEALAAGRYRGGPRPFGYESDGVTIREEEAGHVLAATRQVVAGDSLRSIARRWEAEGVTTVPRRKRHKGVPGHPESHVWSATELRRLLLRARNAGLIEHRGEVIGPACWPAIVPEEEWRDCKAVLEDPGRRTTTTSARRWLLSGLAVCGVCGATMRCSTSGTGSGHIHVPAYRCRSGAHVTRGAEALDEYVESVVVARLSRPDAAVVFMPKIKGSPDLAGTAAAMRRKLDIVTDDYSRDLIGRKQFLDLTAAARTRLAEVEAEMAAAAGSAPLAGLPLGTADVAEVLAGAGVDRKRAVLDVLGLIVTVLPARRGRPAGFVPGSGAGYFDENAVRVKWRATAEGR